MNNVKLSKLWDGLHTSYWFLPGMMTFVSSILAIAMVTLDRTIGFGELSWIYTGGPDGAREVLSAIASSMVSVAATAFSITIVALQLASSHFGPRLLRNFMRDTGNQIVLGTFLSTFIYSLLVLRTIYGEDYNLFVPHLAVTVGIVLAIFSIGVLIYFIHHASTIIQASHVIQSVSDDLTKVIDRLFPEKIGQSPLPQQHYQRDIPDNFASESCAIKAKNHGYLQAIDDEQLMQMARKHNLLLHIQSRPGKFVIKGSVLLLLFPGERASQKLTDEINQCFILGQERTEQQDIEFPVNQLVEIALRAISPAINDPFTAIRCIDRLCAGLCHLGQREFPSPYRYDRDHKLRVIAEPVTFAGVVDAAFNQIRQYARSDASVTIRLLEAIAAIASCTHNPQHQEALLNHADMIEQGSREGLPESQDREDVQKRYQQVLQSVQQHRKMKVLGS